MVLGKCRVMPSTIWQKLFE